ncbi:bifunctional glutamate N-acetyltransferase/amino-acid acetyltransferase ArgJ [Sulfuriflexus mobilis]|uniref:bifunctional glutamate N-acetyltransferase/amino-acid acetyltransferase ArgJ n=1 Tax=Sulfuriflexus mobilis TaxID=1811807 RepID=UPI000F83AB88|nr:bifunctional glutamate N-acetyltransferase/amino-acid acetyltransferase ArgJ [Sulfuriflexus mobilis]
MAVGLTAPKHLSAIAGIRLGTASAGFKQTVRPDLVLIEMAAGSTCAAVFTQNAFSAAPVMVAREHLANHAPRYLLINSGNANAGTGKQGYAIAQASCEAVAGQAGCHAGEVLPFSTGVIGEILSIEKLQAAVPQAYANLREDGWLAAANGIMTTDTLAKGISEQCTIDGKTITVTGMTKGSGMIRPNMATMLAYMATDAAVSQPVLDACLRQAVNASFNRITVDGDTSTNDACILMASGAAGNRMIDADSGDAAATLFATVEKVCAFLAQAIIRDGEGATKFMTIDVAGGADDAECQAVAYTIAHSPLVKTAFFASDPNWGRILAAVGRAGLSNLVLNAITIHLDEVCIVRDGGRASDYTEAAGQKVMQQAEITVRVELGRGKASTRVWTCDLSYDYVRINAEYRS